MKYRHLLVFIMVIMLIGTFLTGISRTNADAFSDGYELRTAIQSFLSTDVMDARWAKTVKDTAIAVYFTESGYGVALLEFDPSEGFSVLEKNDRMIPRMGSSSSVSLDDHTPEYSIEVWWNDSREMDYLTLQADDHGVWRVQSLEYSRKEDDQEDILVFCHLSGDGKTASISPLVDPRIEWSVNQEFTVREFNLADAHKLCENAVAILRDSEREDDIGPEYRIIHAALDQYEPVIPNRFDSRIDNENQLLYLFREDRGRRIHTEWVFHWDENNESWLLAKAGSVEFNDPGLDGTDTVTESITEVTAATIRTTQLLEDAETREILYVCWDASFPNVLDPKDCSLKHFNFDMPPVSAQGYNWSLAYGAYADPMLLPKLFRVFFPEYAYVDGYLQEDKTLIFIGRKPDGKLVLFCGADEGGTGWDWAESTPLPEGARIGDENFTDAVNMNAWKGGAAVGVRKTGPGKWGIYYVNSIDFYVGPDWIGMNGPETNAQFFGTHAWGDITTIDWLSLPPEEYRSSETKAEKDDRISALVDRTDWATPSHSGSEAATELLEEAGNEDTLLGRFYDGTPMHVLERRSDWTRVRIGAGEGLGVMTGWVRTEDLVFRDDTLYVSRETIRINSEQVLIHPVEPFINSRAGRITAGQFCNCLVIGETETDQSYAIVYYLTDGDVGLIPAASLGNGNG